MKNEIQRDRYLEKTQPGSEIILCIDNIYIQANGNAE